MGVVSPKGPNPFESNPNSPRYTQMYDLHKRLQYRGLISEFDAAVLNGISNIANIQPLTIEEVEAGDIALIGNRVGTVYQVQRDDVDQVEKVIAVVVDEHMNYLTPLDRVTPANQSYLNDNIRRTTYNFGVADDDEDVTIVSNDLMDTNAVPVKPGMIIFLKRATHDPKTWNKIAQSVKEHNEKVHPGGLVELTVENITGEEEADIVFEGKIELSNFTDLIPGGYEVIIQEEGTGIEAFQTGDQDQTDIIGSIINFAVEDGEIPINLTFTGPTDGAYTGIINVYVGGVIVETKTFTITITDPA